MKRMTVEDVLIWINDVHDQFQREEDQGILQGRLDKASAALAGKDACERLRREVQMRHGFQENAIAINARKRRG